MKIKLLISIICVIISLLFCISCAANPKVQLNGKNLDFTDENGNVVEAQIINDRTMVPLRKIFSALGCEIEWDQETKTVSAHSGGKTIRLTIGNNEAFIINDASSKEDKIILDSAPVIVDNRTLVPLRFISESLGNIVGWDQANYTAVIVDYDEFSKELLGRSKNIFEMFKMQKGKTQEIKITKKYNDEATPSRSYTTIMTVQSKMLDDNSFEGKIIFSGNSEMVKEIQTEEWSDITFKMIFDEKGVMINTPNYTFSKMLGGKKNETFYLDESTFDFVYTDDLNSYFKALFSLNSSQINTKTYNTIFNEYNKLLNNFMSSGIKKISADSFNYQNIDLSDFYKITNKGSALNVLLLVNKAIFNYNINGNDLLSDFPTISYEFSDVLEQKSSKISVKLKGEYKENYEIIVEMKSNV